MKKTILIASLFVISFYAMGFSRTSDTDYKKTKKDSIRAITPLFQFSGGIVYSNIDLSLYSNSESFRGLHARLITHLHGPFFLSTEFSSFPVHHSSVAWEDIHTRKFDINGHASFATQNKHTRIFVLAGLNKHEWKGKRTGYVDLGQLGQGLAEGTYAKVNRLGLNFGCGFIQSLYENIGVFGDFRFCFTNANNFEKVRIMDVMTTAGINFSIPNLSKSNGKKTFSTPGKKVYKWTGKGAK